MLLDRYFEPLHSSPLFPDCINLIIADYALDLEITQKQIEKLTNAISFFKLLIDGMGPLYTHYTPLKCIPYPENPFLILKATRTSRYFFRNIGPPASFSSINTLDFIRRLFLSLHPDKSNLYIRKLIRGDFSSISLFPPSNVIIIPRLDPHL